MRIVVVTAAIGTTETPPPPPFIDTDRIRYVCASNRGAVQGWELWETTAFDPRRGARGVKLMAPSMFHDAVVIWCDASFDWIASPAKLDAVAAGMHCDLAAFAHPDRQRVGQEAAEVIRCGLAPKDNVTQQVAAYRGEGFDTDADPQRALTTTGVIVFSQGPTLSAFMDLWRQQIDAHTVRDQLSIDYCAWKSGLRIGHLPGNYRNNAFVSYNRDRHRRRRAA